MGQFSEKKKFSAVILEGLNDAFAMVFKTHLAGQPKRPFKAMGKISDIIVYDISRHVSGMIIGSAIKGLNIDSEVRNPDAMVAKGPSATIMGKRMKYL